MILLDTHVLLWLRFRPERLGAQTTQLISQALNNREAAVSAVTFWEVALLQKKRHIDWLPAFEDDGRLRRELLAAGLREILMDGDIGTQAVRLDYPGNDPADRLIIATALAGSHQLITEDRQILEWPGPLMRRRATE